MYFKYGNYQHDPGEITVVNFTQQRMKSKRNRLVFTRYTMTLMGEICLTGQAAIKSRLNDIEDAYKYDFQDAALYHDDGTKSKHHLPNSGTINGVRVLDFSYPKGDKSEYATGRTYRIVLQADYLNMEDTIYSFRETLQFIGAGGPKWELVPHFRGLPTARVIYQRTPQRIIQQGEAVGFTGYPILPSPLMPANYEHVDQRAVTTGSPISLNKHQNLMYPLSYRYVFSSILPLSGYPHEDYH